MNLLTGDYITLLVGIGLILGYAFANRSVRDAIRVLAFMGVPFFLVGIGYEIINQTGFSDRAMLRFVAFLIYAGSLIAGIYLNRRLSRNIHRD